MAKKNKTERMPLSQAFRLSLRAVNLYWGQVPGYAAATFLEIAVTTLSPYVTIWLSAQLINELAGARDPRRLITLALITLLAGAGLTLLGGLLGRWRTCLRKALWREENMIYTDKMMKMDFADVDRQAVHELYYQIEQNNRFQGLGLDMASGSMIAALRALLRILGGVALSVSLFTAQVPPDSPVAVLNSPLCPPLILLGLLGVALLSPWCIKKGQDYWRRSNEIGKQGNRFFVYFASRFPFSKRWFADKRIYNQQPNVCRPYMTRDNPFHPGGVLANFTLGPRGAWIALGAALSGVLTGAVYVFVCLKAWGGAFGVGSVTQYVGAITGLFAGLSSLLTEVEDLRTNAQVGLVPVFQFLDIPNKMYQGSLTTEKRSDRQYEVEFRDVSFQYPGTDTWSLRHVNMKFRVGERLAIVGENGSGKTTFIKLLCRLYDPTEGTILLNGIDIRKYNYDDYIGVFSIVFQDFQLFSLPLGENVAGKKDFDRKKAEMCLKNAGFEGRLKELPKGLDTYITKVLDPEGVQFSGGEQQKIAIARALYKNAPFLILDEPTAALDPVAESEIYEKLDSIVEDKTAVYISHRLSSCKFCDEIAVFDQGRIVQQGRHQALLDDRGGKYAQLWNAQAQYYVEKAQGEEG